VRVRAVSVNAVDVQDPQRHDGRHHACRIPVIPGWDVAGVVTAVGDGAAVTVGDEVFGVAAAGGTATTHCLSAPSPSLPGLSWEAAAGDGYRW